MHTYPYIALHLSLHVSNYRFPVIINYVFSIGDANSGGKLFRIPCN